MKITIKQQLLDLIVIAYNGLIVFLTSIFQSVSTAAEYIIFIITEHTMTDNYIVEEERQRQ